MPAAWSFDGRSDADTHFAQRGFGYPPEAERSIYFGNEAADTAAGKAAAQHHLPEGAAAAEVELWRRQSCEGSLALHASGPRFATDSAEAGAPARTENTIVMQVKHTSRQRMSRWSSAISRCIASCALAGRMVGITSWRAACETRDQAAQVAKVIFEAV